MRKTEQIIRPVRRLWWSALHCMLAIPLSCSTPQPSALPPLSIDLRLPPADSISDPAKLIIVFRNNTDADVELPVGELMVERNLFIRLFRDPQRSPFAPPFARDMVAPFQVPEDSVVTIPPGTQYEYTFNTSYQWITLVRTEHESETDYIGSWYVQAYITARWLNATGQNLWWQAAISPIHRIEFHEPVR